jgi:CubicO group peptidase (beta-lactamase class C family)
LLPLSSNRCPKLDAIVRSVFPASFRFSVCLTGLLIALPNVSIEAAPPALEVVEPHLAGLSSDRLQHIDAIVAEGLKREQMPGCVVLVGSRGKIAWLRAYGSKQLQPEAVPMTTDTVFDLASLTKPIATATSVMTLIEQGRLKLDDRVAQHIPEFAANGKDAITIQHLLTHQGGLIPDNALRDYLDGPKLAFERIHQLELTAEPGSKFIYSDVSFLVLGELVELISGQPLNDYAQSTIFEPLGMAETMFLPNESLRARAAVTQQRDGHWMQGEVHDPRSFALGGVAGHAGLFSTAGDLAKYAQMLINGGKLGDARILSEETVALMRNPVEVPGGLRALGWDVRTGYSSNRGDLLSDEAFGHGGFTGTAIWIDPQLELFVIFLSNRVHPDGKGSVNSLAGRIGTIAAASIFNPPGE